MFANFKHTYLKQPHCWWLENKKTLQEWKGNVKAVRIVFSLAVSLFTFHLSSPLSLWGYRPKGQEVGGVIVDHIILTLKSSVSRKRAESMTLTWVLPLTTVTLCACMWMFVLYTLCAPCTWQSVGHYMQLFRALGVMIFTFCCRLIFVCTNSFLSVCSYHILLKYIFQGIVMVSLFTSISIGNFLFVWKNYT